MPLAKLKELSGGSIWSITMVFFIGVTYSQVLMNSKRLESLELTSKMFVDLKAEQLVLHEKFESQKQFQERFLNSVDALNSTLTGIQHEMNGNIQETAKNTTKLEMIKDTLNEIKNNK